MNKTQTGAYGEACALAFLQKKGYRLLARNYRFGHKEIDLVMRDGDCIAFVEVKARRSSTFGAPREAVDARKQALLIQAAQAYLQRYAPDNSARFDVVEVYLRSGEITHIENAFWGR